MTSSQKKRAGPIPTTAEPTWDTDYRCTDYKVTVLNAEAIERCDSRYIINKNMKDNYALK